MSLGSSNHCPVLPLTDLVDTVMSLTANANPDVSTNPPSPPDCPPSAKIEPCASVTELALLMSLQSTAVPPSPLSMALTSISAPLPMVTVVASVMALGLSNTRRSVLAPPCQSPPTNTAPPPVLPVAVKLALSLSSISSASTTSRPPRAVELSAANEPSIVTVSFAATATMPADSALTSSLASF